MYQLRLCLAALVACAGVVAGRDISFSGLDARGHGSSRNVDFTQLARNLSPTAHIYLPGSDGFNSLAARWSNLSMPVANVVVVPGTENDVIQTVSHFVFALLPIVCGDSLLVFRGLGKVCKQQVSALPCDKWCSRIDHHSRADDKWY